MSGAKSEASGLNDGSNESETRLERTVGLNMDRADEAPAGPSMTKRRFMQGTAATGAVVATGGLGAVAAQSSGIVPNFGSDMTPAPWVGATYTIAEHSSSMGDLGYVDDEGEEVSLADDGAVVAPRDEEDTPHNPVRIRADLLETAEYSAFPRGSKYDSDSDGDVDSDDEDVSVLDATHWSGDESSTGGSLTVEDGGENTLRVSTSGQTAGDTAVATFDLSAVADEDATITEGVLRKYLQVVANVDTLEAGAVVTFAVEDSSGNRVSVTADSSADETAGDVLASSTGSGQVLQTQIGEIDGSADLEDIQVLAIEVAEANADVSVAGLNLERESRWSYGTREFTNSDDELETKTVREPAGYTGIQSTDGLDDTFGDASVRNVEVDVEFRAADLPSSNLDLRVEDADRYDRAKLYELVGGFEFPTAYDLSPSIGSLYGMVRHTASRYLEAGISTGLDEVPDLEDVDDESVDWTARTADFEDGDLDAELELSSTASSDAVAAFYFKLNPSEDEASSMAREAGGGGAPAFSGGGGFLSSVRGMIVAGVLGVVGFLGALRAGMLPGGN